MKNEGAAIPLPCCVSGFAYLVRPSPALPGKAQDSSFGLTVGEEREPSGEKRLARSLGGCVSAGNGQAVSCGESVIPAAGWARGPGRTGGGGRGSEHVALVSAAFTGGLQAGTGLRTGGRAVARCAHCRPQGWVLALSRIRHWTGSEEARKLK